MIKTGVLGCAAIARRSLIPAFGAHDAFEMTAIASRSPEKAAELASQYRCRASTYEELLASSDIGLVYCPLPTGLHYEWVKRALLSGKHVLCEKSLACTVDEVEDLIATARARHLFLMESFQFRFHAQNLHVKKLLAEKRIGEVRQVSGRFGIPPFADGATNIRYSRELGGGALLDNGAYTVKCATYLLGPEVRSLAAVCGGYDPACGGVDTVGSIMMKCGEVPVQTAYGFSHYYQNGYEIWGTEGKITTVRAFTAREDFEAPVIVETAAGREERKFRDDHFARLLDHVAATIAGGDFEAEYDECRMQARILGEVARLGGLR